jgi:hypothetical protein
MTGRAIRIAVLHFSHETVLKNDTTLAGNARVRRTEISARWSQS